MKILQIGDMHLGAKLSGVEKKEARKCIRKHIIQTVDNIENKLKTEEYDGLILTGDIFDSENISYYWLNRVSNIIATVLERNGFVVYATGNHDYFVSESTFKNLPNSGVFKIFQKEEFEYIDITVNEEKWRIHGIGYETYHPKLNISKFLPNKKEERKNILVFHGEVINQSTVNAEKTYLYTDVHSLKNKGYDYVAVGHVHVHEIFENNISYSGCTFPQGFDEKGQKGILSVTLDRSAEVKFNAIAPYQLERLDISVDAEHREALSSKINRIVRDYKSTRIGEVFFKINITISTIFIDKMTILEIEEEIFGRDKNKNSISFIQAENKKEVILPEEILTAVESSATTLKDALISGTHELKLISTSTSSEDIADNMANIISEVKSILKGERYVD